MRKSLDLIRKHLDDPMTVELSAAWMLNRKGLAQQAVADRMLLAARPTTALAPLVADWFRFATVWQNSRSAKGRS